MRIRSTKPEFWRSERVASVDWDARLVLKALESYVDDNGVGKDDLALICGDLFMRDLAREGSRTLARVSEAINGLHQAGLVWRYEARGTALLFIAFWEQVQRVDKPQAGRNPRPDGTMNYGDSVIREAVANPREDSRTLAPGTGEQGNRGTGEQVSLSPDESDDPDALNDDSAGTLIPDHWVPNQRHHDKARSLHLDLDREANRFRQRAHETQRRLKNWDTGFTNWLRKSAEFAQQRLVRAPQPPTQMSKAARNAAEYQRIFGGDHEHAGSVPALDAGIGS